MSHPAPADNLNDYTNSLLPEGVPVIPYEPMTGLEIGRKFTAATGVGI